MCDACVALRFIKSERIGENKEYMYVPAIFFHVHGTFKLILMTLNLKMC